MVCFRAFTLIETLVVLAIAAFLLAMAASGFNRLALSRPAQTAAEGITGVIRSARAFAIAQNTYVVIGLRNVNYGGSPAIELGVAYSRDGLEPEGGASTTALAIKDKLYRWTTVQVQPQAQNLETALSAAIPDVATMAALSDVPFEFTAPPPFGTFSWRVLITPSGEISLQGANLIQPATIIGIALLRAPSTPIPSATAAVVIRGAAGQATVVIP